MKLFSSIWNTGIFGKLAVLTLIFFICGFLILLLYQSGKKLITSEIVQSAAKSIPSSQETTDNSPWIQKLTANSTVAPPEDDLLDLSAPQDNIVVYSNMARSLVLALYGLFGILLLGLLYVAFQTFRGRPTWGQARYMGIPFSLFVWLQIVFYLVVFEGVYDIVGLILQTPLWLDCLISALILIAPLIVFLKVRARTTFKPNLFIPLILIPLGLPATHIVADLAQVGAIKFVRLGAITIVKNSDELQEQIIKRTVGGWSVKFANTHQIGRLGDALTAKKLTALGYTKLNAKYTQIHGIDGIYILRDNEDEIMELILVENKVDTGKLLPGTMSDEWVIERAQKMIGSNNQEVAETGRQILEVLQKNPSVLKRQFWHHHLETGTTTVKEIDVNGVVSPEASTIWEDNFIKNQIQRWCELGSLSCIPAQ